LGMTPAGEIVRAVALHRAAVSHSAPTQEADPCGNFLSCSMTAGNV
jgi:hypothetical protein